MTTLRETPSDRWTYTRRGDIPALWFPRRSLRQRLRDWFGDWVYR